MWGLEVNYVFVLIDGVEVVSLFIGEVDFVNFLFDDFGSIEVVCGE